MESVEYGVVASGISDQALRFALQFERFGMPFLFGYRLDRRHLVVLILPLHLQQQRRGRVELANCTGFGGEEFRPLADQAVYLRVAARPTLAKRPTQQPRVSTLGDPVFVLSQHRPQRFAWDDPWFIPGPT